MDKLNKRNAVFVFFIIFILSILFSFSVGRYAIGPVNLMKILLSRVFDITQTWSAQEETIVFKIRLPRLFLSSLIGAGLALSGLVMQTVFKNPLVSPDVLGTSSGAAFGASLALLYNANYFEVSFAAFLSGLLAVFLVMLIARNIRYNRMLALVLGGIMISSLFSSATSFVKLVADTENTLPTITYWLMGSLSSYRNSDLYLLSTASLIAFIPLLLLSWRINLLSLEEEEAVSLGVDTKKLRIICILSSTLLTAAAVAVSGQIGWIGLVIPHFTRMMVGNDTRTTIPLSMLLGASFLTIVDTISRIATTTEIPLGILTSFVGAPFFLFLISREAKKHDS